jgi:hypothetical protein
MSGSNMVGNLPNKVAGRYQRPLPRDIETADRGGFMFKNELNELEWTSNGVLPPAISFRDLTAAPPVGVNGAVYVGSVDSTSIDSSWGGNVTNGLSWVRYSGDSSAWFEITPQEGMLCMIGGAYNSFDGTSWTAISEQPAISTTWYKRSYTFADFSAAATFKEGVMAVAPANSILRRYRIVHTAAFTGGSISACTLAIKMGSLFTSSYNIFQAPAVTKGADITLSYSTTISDSGGFNISYYVQATGGNLDTLTTGAVDIWFEVITYN